MGYGVNVPTINERFLQVKPQGYLSAEDTAFGERALGRGNEAIGSNIARMRAGSSLRFAQRGIGGAAAEQAQGDLEQGGSIARARLASGVADVMGGLFSQNRDFERTKLMTAWNAELGAKARSDQRRQIQQAAWANSLSAGLGGLSTFFGGGIGMPEAQISAGSFEGIPLPDAAPSQYS